LFLLSQHPTYLALSSFLGSDARLKFAFKIHALVFVKIKLQLDVHGGQFVDEIPENERHNDGLAGFIIFLPVGIAAVDLQAFRILTKHDEPGPGLHVEGSLSRRQHGAPLRGGKQEIPAPGAHVTRVTIAAIQQPVEEGIGGSVGNQGIPLHFAHAYSPAPLAALDGLPGERIDGTGGTDVVLIGDHVTEALVVHDPDEYFGLESSPGHAAVEGVGSVIIVSRGLKLLPKMVEG